MNFSETLYTNDIFFGPATAFHSLLLMKILCKNGKREKWQGNILVIIPCSHTRI